MRKRILFISLHFFCLASFALETNLEPQSIPPSEKISTEEAIESIYADPEFKTCQNDLVEFVKKLTPEDLNKISQMEDQRDSEAHKNDLTRIFKKGLGEKKYSAIKYDGDVNSVSTLIPRAGMVSCEITIVGKLGMDQIKANPDSSEDEKIVGRIRIQRALMGSSYDISSGELHFDPSKMNAIKNQDLVPSFSNQTPLVLSNQGTTEKLMNPEGGGLQ